MVRILQKKKKGYENETTHSHKQKQCNNIPKVSDTTVAVAAEAAAAKTADIIKNCTECDRPSALTQAIDVDTYDRW